MSVADSRTRELVEVLKDINAKLVDLRQEHRTLLDARREVMRTLHATYSALHRRTVARPPGEIRRRLVRPRS